MDRIFRASLLYIELAQVHVFSGKMYIHDYSMLRLKIGINASLVLSSQLGSPYEGIVELAKQSI